MRVISILLPEGAVAESIDLGPDCQRIEYKLDNKRVAFILQQHIKRVNVDHTSLEVCTGFGLQYDKGEELLRVVEQPPVFEAYTAKSGQQFEQVSYLQFCWDRGSAWEDLEQRYAGRFERNPWRKNHTDRLWRWSRPI